MALFIPPLLFLDSWKLPKREFFQLKTSIFGLAFGLTVVNVVVGGYLIYIWLPNIPLAAGFALAAILSPTDVVAVLAITKRLPLPSAIQHLLAGEALINDASSLIALKFAVATLITGHFCWWCAVKQFILVTLGGVALGCSLAYGFSWLCTTLLGSRRPAYSQLTLLLLLLLPFVSYRLAEHSGVSGILSVVSTGMLSSYLKNSQTDSATTRLQARSFWNFLEYTFNGVIFLLLGLQLLPLIRQIAPAPMTANSSFQLLVAIAGISALLLLLRLTWLFIFSRLLHWPHASTSNRMNWPQIIISSFSGIRGALTLSAALSLPLLLPDNTPFPAREQLIFIAIGVILLTLFLGALAIPRCIPILPTTAFPFEQLEKRRARRALLQALLQQIEIEQWHYTRRLIQHNPQSVADFTTACEAIKRAYEQALSASSKSAEKRQLDRWLCQLQQRALQTAHRTLYQLRHQNKINDTTLQHLEYELDLRTETLERPP